MCHWCNNAGLAKQVCLLMMLVMSAMSSVCGADCACDYTVPKELEEVWLVTSPSVYAHQKYWPLKRKGETIICLEVGVRNRLYIRDFDGGVNKDGSRYVFRNCGGVAEIRAPQSNGITFYNCRDIKLSGTGDPGHTYGIKISETRYNGTNYGNAFGISLEGYSEKAEIEFTEITHTGFSAIAAKTDGGVYYPDKVTRFVMHDLRLHHNYIHDLLKGEGFYIGHNQWSESRQHRLDGIYIYSNRLENIPWDGIQVGGTKGEQGGTPGNAEIYGNIIINYGLDTQAIDSWQNNGINLSSGFSGKCYNNFIKRESGRPGGNAIIAGGAGDIHIFNNILITPREAGIFGNPSQSAPAESGRLFYFYNNTIVDPGTYGIVYRIPSAGGNFVNNLVTGGKGLYMTAPGCMLRTASNWWTEEDKKKIFADPSADNYRLRTQVSEAVNKGSDLSGPPYYLHSDFAGTYRPYKNVRFDIGAFELTQPE